MVRQDYHERRFGIFSESVFGEAGPLETRGPGGPGPASFEDIANYAWAVPVSRFGTFLRKTMVADVLTFAAVSGNPTVPSKVGRDTEIRRSKRIPWRRMST